jgi:PKD repeat protein
MYTHKWQPITLIFLALITLASVTTFAQNAPQGIIVVPPGDLLTDIRTDRPAYVSGQTVLITYNVNQPAYIYVFNIDAAGTVRLIFPNQFSQANFVQAGEHLLPDNGSYTFAVAPPFGTEYLQIIATTQPINLGQLNFGQVFPLIGTTPQAAQGVIQGAIQGLIPTGKVATAYTVFQTFGSAPIVLYGTLNVTTDPDGAEVIVNGIFRGFAPKSLFIEAGTHTLLARKAGYLDASRIVVVQGGERKEIFLRLAFAGNRNPLASFTYGPPNPFPGQSVTFDGAHSTDPDGDPIIQHLWDFNSDGIFDAAGVRVSRSFANAGSHRVTLRVVDGRGAVGEQTQTIMVANVLREPQACFTVNPNNPLVGQTVVFNASCSLDPDGFIVAYLWDFNNDGIFEASGLQVSRAFATAGTRVVRLRVVDNSGRTDSVSHTLVVGNPIPTVSKGFVVSPIDATHLKISVRGDQSWFIPHKFRITIFSDGTINEIRRDPPSGTAPQAIVPTPTGGSQFELNENISTGRIDYIIGFMPSTSKLGLELRLDLDGDGDLEKRTDFVWLTADGAVLKHPLSNPFVLQFPAGFLLPFDNLRICLTFSLGPEFSVTFCVSWRDL